MMEFNHKRDDDRTSTYFAASGSADGYFTQQALRAGYIGSEMGKNDFMRNPVNVRVAILRELEKEKIRDRIIAEERRALEMEVRSELLFERELALQRGANGRGFSLMSSSATTLRADQSLSLMVHPERGKLAESFAAFPTRVVAGMNQREGARPEERVSLPLPHPPSEVRVLEKLPLQCSEPRVGNVKPLSEVGNGQVLFFAKPTNSGLDGMKKKVVEPLVGITGAVELPSGDSKTKVQGWRCALCKVHATSEQVLNDHLQGKKHRSKEAALLAYKTTSKNTGNSTSLTKGTDKPTMTASTTINPKSKRGKKQKGNKQKPVKQCDAPLQKKRKMQHWKNTGEAPEQKKQRTEASKKFKYWCEMCQVGARCRIVMKSHERGKKHLSQLENLKKENGSITGITTSLESTHEKPKNTDTKNNEATGEMENIDGEVDGIEEAIKEAGEATEDESAEIDMVDRSVVEESTELGKDDSGPSYVPVALVEGLKNQNSSL